MLMRMTSDDPEYIAGHLNIFFAQDGEGYIRAGGQDKYGDYQTIGMK